jgi:hypothetical protein
MSKLLCPKCSDGGQLKWVSDMDAEDLLDNGTMECQDCKNTFVGIRGWREAWDDRRKDLK